MHRAVLLSTGDAIEEFANRLPDGQPMSAAPDAQTARVASMAAEAAQRSFVGQTVAEVEQHLIIRRPSATASAIARTPPIFLASPSARCATQAEGSTPRRASPVPAPQGFGANAA